MCDDIKSLPLASLANLSTEELSQKLKEFKEYGELPETIEKIRKKTDKAISNLEARYGMTYEEAKKKISTGELQEDDDIVAWSMLVYIRTKNNPNYANDGCDN